MDLRMYWIVRNGAFAAALYFAMVEHVGWLMYAIGAFACWQLASSAWAMADPATQKTAPPHEIFLGEEELSDVSLSTFYVFDKESAKPQLRRTGRLVARMRRLPVWRLPVRRLRMAWLRTCRRNKEPLPRDASEVNQAA